MWTELIFTVVVPLTGVTATPLDWQGECNGDHLTSMHNWPGWGPKPSVYSLEQLPQTWAEVWWHRGKQKPTQPVTTQAPCPPSYLTATPTSSRTAVNNACGSIRDIQASQTRVSPSATATVPAELAYECINSVPFNSSAAVAFLDSIRPYLSWQTTIQWLKDPPAEYAENVQPPYDFYAELDRIYEQAQSGSYENEYRFGFEVREMFQRAHDGHFAISPDSVTAVFSYGRTTPLVSVSLDGETIPDVYVYQDILDVIVGNASFTPSPLKAIDGQDSTEFLLNFSQYGSLQDRDALWNNMFYLLQQVSLGSSGTGTGTFSGGGSGRWIYPGPSTTLAFVNGSEIVNQNFARVLVPFDNITSGADIYQQYFVPPPGSVLPAFELASSTSTSSSSTSSSTSTTTPAPGFPTPFIRQGQNLNSGYFLDGEEYDDIAILSVASFVGSEDGELDFQAVNTYLIDEAVKRNKTRLIVDVSANGGGTILQGYDLFKQLFPTILPYGANRFRAHEAHDYIGQEFSAYSGLVPRSLDLNDTASDIVSSNFNYRTDSDVDYKPFTSWPDKFGPEMFGPQLDNYTRIIRWNLSDVLTPVNSEGIYISGYLNRSNITTQPFASENIVVVTDGYCASTCTIFSELMRQQAGVKYVNLGGRPNRALTQAIGGVKGTNDYPYDYILSAVTAPFQTQLLRSALDYNASVLGTYNNLWSFRTTAAVINSRDGFRLGDKTNVPLQFRYDLADCRIFYTPEMAVDQVATWKTVADAAFHGVNHCVAGSLGGEQLGEYDKQASPAKEMSEKKKHGVRQDVNLYEHYLALTEVWTGRDGVVTRGKNVMAL